LTYALCVQKYNATETVCMTLCHNTEVRFLTHSVDRLH